MTSLNMKPHAPPAATGAGMDTVLPARKGRRAAIAAAWLAGGAIAAGLTWLCLPRGLQVPTASVRLASVERGTFLDDMVVRTSVAALNAVLLDTTDAGKVDAVMVEDGALVKQGELLFRLSNPQRRLDLLERQSEYAQQISNLSTLRAALESSRIDHQRRIAELEFGLAKTDKERLRNQQLAAQGFIADATYQESLDLLQRQRRAVEEERGYAAAEAHTRQDAIAQMERAIAGLQTGLGLFNEALEALSVRAPMAGRLTDFHLQRGETVQLNQHIGRIDDPNHFKLLAQMDEYYLSRIAVGHQGYIVQNATRHAVRVSRVFPQIKEGRFLAELTFTTPPPQGLHPGQNLDATIKLGEPSPALLLPNGAFLHDGGGVWVFVVDASGAGAERRAIRLGRRNQAQVEVLAGLTAGDTVIVSSYAAYDKASRLALTK